MVGRAPAAEPPPPLIDREILFADPEIVGPQLSPDGTYLAFLRPIKGTLNVWVRRIDEPMGAARPLSGDTDAPVAGFFWSRDSKHVLFVRAADGGQDVFAVAPDAPAAKDLLAPIPRNLTQARGARAQVYGVPRHDPDALWIGLNEREPATHDLYKVQISTARRTLLRENKDRVAVWYFDLEDRVRLASRTTEGGDTEILRVDEDGLTRIAGCTAFETCQPSRFHTDGKRVYMVGNAGAEADHARLTLLDLATGSDVVVESDPLGRVDLGGPLFSEKTDELVGTQYVDDRRRLHFRDPGFERDHGVLRGRLPGRDLLIVSSTGDDRLWLVLAQSDVEPGEVHLLDRPAQTLKLQYRVRDGVPRASLSPMEALRYRSADGLEISAYLTRPKGYPRTRLPLVVLPHGGPWTRDYWGFDPWTQLLANRGYAVLQPNFRGSAGYGKRFLDAGDRQWGDAMQEDVTAGVKHLVTAGIADPQRVAIFGASYGGYAALAGLTFTPDVYAAGVALSAPADLVAFAESVPPFWESYRRLLARRLGDSSTAEGRTQLARQSPVRSVGALRAPLLLVHGEGDQQVKKADVEQIVVALRDRRVPVEYLLADDEGHGLSRPVNNLAALAAAEAFLAKHLRGRRQEDTSPVVASRLRELRVDLASVEIPPSIDPASVGVPRPMGNLTAGTVNYKARIEMAGNAMEVAVSSDVKEEDGTWVVTDTAETPMGTVRDRTVVDKASLVLRRRTIERGPMTIELTVEGGKATGEMKMGEQVQPIAVDLGGDLFADGAGASLVVATLPLEEGYSTTFRNLDVQARKVKAMQLKVVGRERVTVPAGTFDAFKLELRSADDDTRSTLWVAREPRKVVKTLTVAPRIGGTTVTSELQP